MAKKRITKRQQKQMAKFAVAHWKIVLVLLLIVVALGITAYFMGWLDFLFVEQNPVEDTAKPSSPTERMSTAGGYTTTMTAPKDLVVNYLNVGQADCMVIYLPDGKTMIIDSGDSSGDRDLIKEYTDAINTTTIDYLLLTHSDQDHVGNMDWIFANYDVRYVFRPNEKSNHDLSSELPEDFNTGADGGYVVTSKIYAKFMVAAYNEENCTCEIFDKNSDFSNKIICGETEYTYTFDFLTPLANAKEVAYSNPNNYSPIMTLEYAGRKLMFNGDAELEALGEYVAEYGSTVNIDVLKVGHHGSRNATTEAFVSAVDPEYAVIQVKPTVSYKLPNTETLEALDNHGAAIYRNDMNGDIVLTINTTGTMTWAFDNDDMSNNMKSGAEVLGIEFNIMPDFDIIYEDRRIKIS